VFTIGGPASFEPLSAKIRPVVREEIERVAVMLMGRNNKILVRGHAAAKYLPANAQWADLYELSYQRARNVMKVLVDLGLDERVLRLEAVGSVEPAHPRAVDEDDVAENRRVEIILTEQLADETNTDLYGTDVNLARGG